MGRGSPGYSLTPGLLIHTRKVPTANDGAALYLNRQMRKGSVNHDAADSPYHDSDKYEARPITHGIHTRTLDR